MTSCLALFIHLNLVTLPELAQLRWFNLHKALHEMETKMQCVTSGLFMFVYLYLVTSPDLAQLRWFNLLLAVHDMVIKMQWVTPCLFMFVYLHLATSPDLAQLRWFNLLLAVHDIVIKTSCLAFFCTSKFNNYVRSCSIEMIQLAQGTAWHIDQDASDDHVWYCLSIQI
jgi:hypothetical protein